MHTRACVCRSSPASCLPATGGASWRSRSGTLCGRITPRKNWSSLVLWNCDHPAHNIIKAGAPNVWTGRQLHTLSWLNDEQIGEIPPEWNWIDGVTPDSIVPKAVHYTAGGPWFNNYRNAKFATAWHAESILNDIQNDIVMTHVERKPSLAWSQR